MVLAISVAHCILKTIFCYQNNSELMEQEVKMARLSRNNHRKIKFKNHSRRVKPPVLKCRVCGLLNKTKTLLLTHLESHIGTPISCKHCIKGFNNRASFLCHISLKMCRKFKKFSCEQCQKVFRFKRHFERHVDGHRRNNCTYCDVRLTRRKQLVNHLLTVHSIKLEHAVMFKCEFCDKRYVKKQSLYHHLKQHSGNKIVCMECGWMSKTAEDHGNHVKGHDKDRPWICERCGDRFSRRQQYLVHIKRHDRYKCVTCNEMFALKRRAERHKQRGHTVQGLEPQMKCSKCPMAFQRRLSLQIHMKKHSEDKLSYCKYCDKTFRTPYLYIKHCTTTIHQINSPEKQPLYEICGKIFLKKHQVLDTSKELLTCEYCPHRTTNKTNMERHLALHLEVKKEVICEQCGKDFYNVATLKDHLSYVHSQERIFKCDQCEKAFKRNSELIRHKGTHSELRPFVCQTCGVTYKRSTHLRRHEESQHGSVPTSRRVQRLTRNENGVLVPVPSPKNSAAEKGAKSGKTSQLNSFDQNLTASGFVTVNHQNFSQHQNSFVLTQGNLPQNYLDLGGNLGPEHQGQYSDLVGVLGQPITVQNSTTCDILLPDNRVLNLLSTSGEYSQSSYSFL